MLPSVADAVAALCCGSLRCPLPPPLLHPAASAAAPAEHAPARKSAATASADTTRKQPKHQQTSEREERNTQTSGFKAATHPDRRRASSCVRVAAPVHLLDATKPTETSVARARTGNYFHFSGCSPPSDLVGESRLGLGAMVFGIGHVGLSRRG